MSTNHPAGRALRGKRDFEAEREWLRRLPPGPETDAKMVEWERDPGVTAWLRTQVSPFTE